MSCINKLNNNLPGYLLHIKDRQQGNMLKPKPLSGVKAVVPILRLVTTGGEWENTSDYLYYETSPEGMFLYSLVNTGTDTKVFAEYYDVGYDPINIFFYGISAFSPTHWGSDDMGSIISAFPSATNMKAHHWYDVFGNSKFSFNNPYYVPDTEGSSITSEAVLSTIANTYTIEVDEPGFFYSINGKAFNFTTNNVVIRTFTRNDETVNITVQGSTGDAFSSSINLIYTDPTINSVNITSNYNNINITMNITNPQYGWQSYLINNDTSEVREVTEYQYGLTERFANMSNGNWVYRVTGDEEFVSNIFTLNYIPPIAPVQLIQPTGGTCFNVHNYKYFQTTSTGRFLYGLINKGETERHLDGNLNDVEYDTIEKRWYDVGIFFPKKWNIDDGESLNDIWPTTPNLPIQFWYNDADSLQFQFDDPCYVATSITTDVPILTQVGETYTIEVVGENLESEGWYYSINGASFNFTTDVIQTRSFTVSQTVTVVVQGTSGDEFTGSINLIIPYYQIMEPTGGTWDPGFEYYYVQTTSEGRYLYHLVSAGTTDVDGDGHGLEYDPSDKKWHDANSSATPGKWSMDATSDKLVFPTAANLETQYFYNDVGGALVFQFTFPYYVAPLEPVARIDGTGGSWKDSFDYFYFETTEGRYLYGLVNKGDTTRYQGNYDFDVEYDPIDSKFHDVGSYIPAKWGIDANGTSLSAFPTSANMQTHFWYHETDAFKFQFDNPYYVAPAPEPVVEPVQRLVFTGGDWESNYDYLYMGNTSDDRFMYSLVDEETTNTVSGDNFDVEYDPSDGKFYDIGGLDPYKWGIDNSGANISDFPTAGNIETHYWYNSGGDLKCQFNNPYYEA